jgi:hypothetical protein
MTTADTATITIGAGGTGGATNTSSISPVAGTKGGDSSVLVNNITYTAGGGQQADGDGGSGDIIGAPGNVGTFSNGGYMSHAGSGGGNGGGTEYSRNGTDGGGGASGYAKQGDGTALPGGNGGNGYVFVEYFDPTLQ